jgi:predicted TIM-barrel fold metal-dependent hydrolase
LDEAVNMLNRRELLNLGASAGVASLLASDRGQAAEESRPSFQIVDSNVSLFHWPFHRLPLDETDKLLNKLRSLGIHSAWAGSFEGVLHRDVAGVNQRLAEECKKHPELVPIGSVNLALPDWKEDLRRCIEIHQMPGVRLHPNYHGYALDDPRFAELLELSAKARRFVQIAAAMEDTRTQYPLLQTPDVDLTPLAAVMNRIKSAKVQILNVRPRPPLLSQLAKTPGIYFDTARAEGTDGVPNLVKSLPRGRVLFGTHAPFLIPEAALIRVHESNLLDEAALKDIFSGNAEKLIG